ncbi:MAG: serine/threonine-protein phosphatase [Clostridia bacterium]|nr:serine/threonine-protein phosphatase [Clostridia bacterium]
MKYIGGCHTDRGGFRPDNEDAILLRTHRQEKGSFVLGAVCDGIGGLESGELASRFVADSVGAWFDTITSWLDLSRNEPALLFSHLQDGAETWNTELIDYMLHEGIRSGTTMSVIMIVCAHAYILHVGDSRIYRYNPEKGLCQLTTDASVTKMSNGRMRSFLDNFMGKSEELWFQLWDTPVEAGDLFLYCSDGFYHTLHEEDAAYYHSSLADGKDPDVLCAEAVQTAISRGEQDNISVGMIYAQPKRSGAAFSFFRK